MVKTGWVTLGPSPGANVGRRATVTTTGHAFTARSIQVFRIRDGKILCFRDYVNPNDLAKALGA